MQLHTHGGVHIYMSAHVRVIAALR
jgi:hypothetical protein